MTFAEAIDEALSKIARATHDPRGSFVNLPLRYPSGASVVLQITEVGDTCFITDYGMGYQEAELINATRSYSRYANSAALEAGIRYDGREFFIAEVSKGRLAAAMVTVADCSYKAAAFAAFRILERHERELKELAFDRIRTVFGSANIDRDVPILGDSGHSWPVSFVVHRSEQRALFEIVTPHANSIYSAVAKFSDISRLEVAPSRVCLVRNAKALGDLVGVIRPVASGVIELTAANDSYMRLSQAA